MTIITNKAKCKVCEEVLESKNRWDFQACRCFGETSGRDGIAVDGGLAYLKRCGNPADIIELSEVKEDE